VSSNSFIFHDTKLALLSYMMESITALKPTDAL
jgi:hypothetical protein